MLNKILRKKILLVFLFGFFLYATPALASNPFSNISSVIHTYFTSFFGNSSQTETVIQAPQPQKTAEGGGKQNHTT